MFATIRKWGNSFGVRLPNIIVKSLNISSGTQVEITEHDGKITLKPVQSGYTLEELVSSITEDNRHEESDTVYPVGKEVW
ncbi:MAG: AbrB/MazE/SpoVT family DNA-binding domain-containing protein [Nitrospirae bacterium]|nr:AbrB/MazE/SpoVT family DNA-binding domain-containing protein [Nitrospirota bacterium]